MFVESIRFQREKNGKWERGYYVGETDNCEHSVILDSNYQPLPKDENGYEVWNYHTDTTNWIQFRCGDNITD